MTNNDLDNLFKDALKDREVPFNPEAWNKADSMLKARSARRKKIFFYKAAAAAAMLLMVAVAGGIWLTGNFSQNEAEANAAKSATAQDNALRDAGASDEVDAATENNTDLQHTEEAAAPQAAESSAPQAAALRPAQSSGSAHAGSTSTLNGTRPVNRTGSGMALNEGSDQNSATTAPASPANNSFNAFEPSTPFTMSALPAEFDEVVYESPDVDPDVNIVSNMPDFKPVIKHRLGVLAGASGSRGFTHGARPGEGAVDPHFGLTYEYLASPDFSLEVNALYRMRSASGLHGARDYSVYSFGRTDYTFTAENERAHYLEIPVFANWHVNEKNQFKVGASFSYLLRSSNDVSLTSQSPFAEDLLPQDVAMVDEGSGVVRSIDVALQAGYEYEMFSKLSVGARAYYGLLDASHARLPTSPEIGSRRNAFLSAYLKFRFADF